ncbi:alcohol dehydrogenase catalytic domain-containing protein [Streptomyces humidus]|uniref:alcohol dehydrogenase catalytic domain-containing protein n=1 Tax=Streptomyces humidus TaxID=52259 RepID=UPI003320D6B5
MSLNCRDLLVVAGQYNPRIALPLVPMSESAGTVVESGAGATKFPVGTRVMPIHAPGLGRRPCTGIRRRPWG